MPARQGNEASLQHASGVSVPHLASQQENRGRGACPHPPICPLTMSIILRPASNGA